MVNRSLTVLSVAAAIILGWLQLHSAGWGVHHAITAPITNFMPLRGRESLAELMLMLTAAAIIAAIARRRAAWLGALSAVTYEAFLILDWVALPLPRPPLSIDYGLGVVVHVAVSAIAAVMFVRVYRVLFRVQNLRQAP